jgi:hypothetical protein
MPPDYLTFRSDCVILKSDFTMLAYETKLLLFASCPFRPDPVLVPGGKEPLEIGLDG